MPSNTSYMIVFTVCCALAINGGEALYCSQCSSLVDPLCGFGLVRPTRCPTSAVACLTYMGKMPVPGADVIIRDCADKDHGSFCQEVPARPDTFAHSFCVLTCHKNGCNDIEMRAPPVESGVEDLKL